MKIIDLTHEIKEGMPVYPGTLEPKLIQANTIEKDGFAEKLITMVSHTGTHMDAPCHTVAGQKTISELDINDLCGKACMIDVTTVKGKITADMLRQYDKELKAAKIAVLYSGWDKYWGDEKFFTGFPVMDTDAAAYLVSTGVKGVVSDMISVDSVDCFTLDVHRVLFTAGMFVAENLKGLDRLKSLDFEIGIFPLNIKDGDGSPIRALAFLKEQPQAE